MLRSITLILISPLALMAVGCSSGQTAATTLEPIVTEPEIYTYVDDAAGFAFEYPAGWHKQDFAGAEPFGFGLTTYDPAFPPLESRPGDPSIVSINFGLLPPAVNIESVSEWAVQYRRELDQSARHLEVEEFLTLPSGLQAVRFRVVSRSGMTVDTVLVIVNGQRLVIGAQGNFQKVSQVLNTLRPL